ncbi:hypothetical protein [Nocardia amamiensis]|uniref:hypothetical protein n=1 Tax=Nocardia amamiensis TaxID=404578 RepID=UPI0033C1F19F
MTSRFLARFFDDDRSGTGRVARELAAFLKTTHQRTPRGDTHVPGPVDGLTSPEKSVRASVDNSLAAADQKVARKLLARINRLITTAHTNERRWAALVKLLDHPRWTTTRGFADAKRPSARSGGASRTEVFDHDHPLASPRVLAVIEIVVLVVEFFFWYATFAEGIDRSVAWYAPERINAYLLALFVPMAGIAAARLAGGLAHRWFHDYSGVSTRRHWEAVVAVILFAVVVVAVVRLVWVRFGESGTALGGTSLPAGAMAALFGAVLVIDMASRTFLVSEIRQQYQRRAKRFRKLEKKHIKANDAQAKAWAALRNQIEVGYDQAWRIETVGSKLLSDGEALWGNPRRVHAEPPEPRALETMSSDDDRSAMSLPTTQSLYLLHPERGVAPSRVLEGAVDYLKRYRPWDPDQLTAKIQEVWTELHRDHNDNSDEDDEPGKRAWGGGISGRQAS